MKRYLTVISDRFLQFIASKVFLIGTLIWFLVQSVFIAFSTKSFIPPDERYHTDLIQLFQRDGLDPYIQNQEGFYSLGQVTRSTSFLYHYLLSFPGRLLDILGFEIDVKILVYRLLSIGLGLITLLTIWKIFDLVRASRLTRNMTVFMLSNTLMFVFLSASVNYDNLLFALLSCSIFFFIKLIKKFSARDFFAFLIAALLASLTKFTFLPVFFVMALVLLYFYRDKLELIFSGFSIYYKDHNKSFIALFLVVLLLLFVNFERYGGNVIYYGSLDPSCDKVLSYEQCQESALFRRALDFQDLKPDPSALIPITDWSSKWFFTMQEGIFGVLAHRRIFPPRIITASMTILLLMLTAFTIRKIKKKDRIIISLLGLAIFYVLVLMIKDWSGYLEHGVYGVAYQGRYLLPVLFLFYGIGVHYMYKSIQRYRISSALATLFIIMGFFTSSLPVYIVKTNVDWYSPRAKTLNTEMDRIIDVIRE